MANIQGDRRNFIHYRNNSSSIDLASDGVVTGGNTARVFKANADGSWSSYKPGRSINGFTTLSAADTTNETGTVYLIDALTDYQINDSFPIASFDETPVGALDPTVMADDVTWLVNNSHDKIPNFAVFTGTRITSQTNGDWSNAATWDLGRVPTSDDVVWVKHAIAYDNNTTDSFKVVAIMNGGDLSFITSGDTYMRVQHLLVRETGTLKVGTVANPIPNGTTAIIEIANVALDTINDPAQYGNGLAAR